MEPDWGAEVIVDFIFLVDLLKDSVAPGAVRHLNVSSLKDQDILVCGIG